MASHSAGLLLYRWTDGRLEVLLVHPGGPFWARRDAGSWSVPKGEFGPEEEPLVAARREFTEEVGLAAPEGTPVSLGAVRQPGGKTVTAFAYAADVDPAGFRSNTFELEWPAGSGRHRGFPEVDRVEWFTLASAREKLLAGQLPLLDRLVQLVSGGGATPTRSPA